MGCWMSRNSWSSEGSPYSPADSTSTLPQQYAMCPGLLIIDPVSRLVDKSLVHVEQRTRGRDTASEVVRQYAEARLTEAGELAACRRRHLEWVRCRSMAHDLDRGAAVVGEPSGWFDLEQDNPRAASATALATDPTTALQLSTFVLALLGQSRPDSEEHVGSPLLWNAALDRSAPGRGR